MALILNNGDDQKKQRMRNILLGSFAILFIIWTIKLSFPQHTIVSILPSPSTFVGTHSPSSSPSPSPSPDPTSPIAAGPSIVFADPTALATNNTKAAVIIETRFRTNLIPLILHFSSVLGPTWPILIYTSAESVGLFGASSALARYLHTGQIQIRLLPQTVLFTNSNSVNAFMTKSWLWESLAPVEHVLIFQSDSMLCANAARSVDDFFEYDLVGAPIKEGLGKGYNGGLSLRSRSKIMRVLKRWDWTTQQTNEDRFEDQWYFNRLTELQTEDTAAGIQPTDPGAINLPSMEVARTFAVETIDYPHPLGVHQVHRWLKESEHQLSLDTWCPEYKLCSEEHINDT